jgi:membrane protein DedA with SNARE-associated domain
VGITELLAVHVTRFIDATGYASVSVFMLMESMVFPVPSEAVMPFAGFLIAEGRFTFFGVIFFSTLGSIAGSLVSYYMGAWGGKPFVNRFGKYFLLNQEDLDFTQKFFNRFGDLTIFASRFIPVVRHLISIPAGIGKMPLVKFCAYTIVGAGLWNSFLAVVGFKLRQNWEAVMKYSHVVDIAVVAILAMLLILFVARHLRRKK